MCGTRYWTSRTRALAGSMMALCNLMTFLMASAVLFGVIFVRFALSEQTEAINYLLDLDRNNEVVGANHSFFFSISSAVLMLVSFYGMFVTYDNSHLGRKWRCGTVALHCHVVLCLISFIGAALFSWFGAIKFPVELEENLDSGIETVQKALMAREWNEEKNSFNSKGKPDWSMAPQLHKLQVNFECCGGVEQFIPGMFSCCNISNLQDCSHDHSSTEKDDFYQISCPTVVMDRFEFFRVGLGIGFIVIATLKVNKQLISPISDYQKFLLCILSLST